MDALTTLSRVPRRPPRADVALTALLLGWAAIEAVVVAGPGTLWQRLAFAAGVTLPLVLRRRAPIAVLAVIIALLMMRVFTITGPENTTFPFPSLLVATFSVALHGRRTGLAVLGGVVTVATMLSLFPLGYYSNSPDVGQVLILGFFVTGAWLAGYLIRVRVAQADAASSKADAAREAAALAARQAYAAREAASTAVTAERERIARELHDVVAHSLSIVAVQAGAAEELIALDPESARRHIAAARSTAREALTEMRHVLDVLRDDDRPAELVPQPTLERVGDLVDEARAAGLPVDLTVDGDRGNVPAGIDLAGFRIVQEALTNVRRHAAGAATEVRIGYREREIDINVRNTGGAPAAPGNPGRGLIGMRERARLYGGTVTAEPGPGGFTVAARLPRDPA
ncbi:sensor histidine kinase [Actinoplanes aureus]|uniref:histidine kinase n=1 Tax=Actinoplanes aureus TaxID=2792083 RepID=A0A931FV78_9ACTN|nr:sensor histidine kinase [Actinoplanes aureus]MBG0561028.1 sensor histidine kinase [Actinoplanes aureus]